MPAFLSLWLLCCTYVDGDVPERETANITFFDVGQGLSVLLEQNGRYALYDTGPDSMGIWDSLKSRHVDSLDWIVISHNHRDHGGGFIENVKNFPWVGEVFVSSDTAGGFVRDSVASLCRKRNIVVDTLLRGDHLRLGSLDVKVLWPTAYGKVGENGASIVLQILLGEASVLLVGDLDAEGEQQLLELSPSLRTDLLQVGHHGSAGSSSLKFLSQVSPQYAVISVGEKNNYGHPTSEVLQKLYYVVQDSSSVLRTDKDGTVEFELTNLEKGVFKK
ncbi:MAG: MBL fold metallo-hydrolase, partial [Fibrobacter sp.]|nr:MBL fold metallo-hydrolase [Fibrobacter sp.]